MNVVQIGTSLYAYLCVPGMPLVRIGTTPFRDVPFVPRLKTGCVGWVFDRREAAALPEALKALNTDVAVAERRDFPESCRYGKPYKTCNVKGAKTSQNLMPELCFSVKAQARGTVDAHSERAIFQSCKYGPDFKVCLKVTAKRAWPGVNCQPCPGS